MCVCVCVRVCVCVCVCVCVVVVVVVVVVFNSAHLNYFLSSVFNLLYAWVKKGKIKSKEIPN